MNEKKSKTINFVCFLMIILMAASITGCANKTKVADVISSETTSSLESATSVVSVVSSEVSSTASAAQSTDSSSLTSKAATNSSSTKSTATTSKKPTTTVPRTKAKVPVTAAPKANATVSATASSKSEIITTARQPKLTMPTVAQLEVINNEFIRLVNAERARLGVAPVTVESKLMAAASIRAKEGMAFYSHTRPDGTNFGTVFDQVQYGTPYQDISVINGKEVTQILYDYGSCGEILGGSSSINATNIADGNGYHDFTASDSELKATASDMFKAFKNSPGHYNIMKNPNYHKIGFGTVAEYESWSDGMKSIRFVCIGDFTHK